MMKMQKAPMILVLILALILAVRGAARLIRNNDFGDDLMVTGFGGVIAIIAAVTISRSSAK